MPHMARGPSGRVVVEVDRDLKRRLHARLVNEGRTLKDWFLEQAERYLTREQQELPFHSDGSGGPGSARNE